MTAAKKARKPRAVAKALPAAPRAPRGKRKSADDQPAPVMVNRDNYARMSGAPLRDFAHKMGIARSEAERLSDDKLKVQIRYAIGRQYDEA